MLSWVPVAYANSDVEGVHQVRIALRRMRSALAIFSRAMPANVLSPWSEEMRWMAAALGPARDLDVFISESIVPLLGKTPYSHGEKVLMELARNKRAELYVQVQHTLDSPRYQIFVKDFSHWLEMRGWFQRDMLAKDRLKMTQGIRNFSIKILEKRFRKICVNGESLETLSDEALHELRIECKKMRYATDFFSLLFPGESMRLFVRNLKAIQNILGLMNDVAALPRVMDGLVDGLTNPEVLRFSGTVLGWRTKGYADARQHLTTRWSHFISIPPPWRRIR